MIRLVLRGAAIAIAIAGIVDPVFTRGLPVPQRLTIVVAEQPPTADPFRHASSGGSVAAWATGLELRSLLESEFDVSLRPHRSSDRAASCPGVGGCILVSDGTLPGRLSDGAAIVGAVLTRDKVRPAIVGIASASGASLDAAGALDVAIDPPAARGVTRVQVFDGNALVGQADREQSEGGPSDDSPVTVRVQWVPIAAGARRLRVVASNIDGDRVTASDDAETAVEVRTTPARIVMYEPQATWMGAFVRRALEDDGRFVVEGRVQPAPPVAISRGRASTLREATLDDAAAVVVGAPDRLTAGEVDLLERYARVRGGSVVLLPDAEPSGPFRRLLPAIAGTTHEPEPQAVGDLRARDVTAFAVSPGVTPIASAGDRAVVIARAIGRGRIVVSGALDAWRYRENARFPRFWSGLVADAAAVTGPAVRITLDRALLEPGEQTTLHAEWRTMRGIPPGLSAEASIECGEVRRPIRLWPDARRGSFSGMLDADVAGTCVVTAEVGGAHEVATTNLVVASGVKRPIAGSSVFERAIEAHGGLVVPPGNTRALVEHARALLPPVHEPRETRPMRSPWWLVPFAACLGAEWAIRRRRGLR